MQEKKIYDAIIIGCGPFGAMTAALLAEKGMKVAILDSRKEEERQYRNFIRYGEKSMDEYFELIEGFHGEYIDGKNDEKSPLYEEGSDCDLEVRIFDTLTEQNQYEKYERLSEDRSRIILTKETSSENFRVVFINKGTHKVQIDTITPDHPNYDHINQMYFKSLMSTVHFRRYNQAKDGANYLTHMFFYEKDGVIKYKYENYDEGNICDINGGDIIATHLLEGHGEEKLFSDPQLRRNFEKFISNLVTKVESNPARGLRRNQYAEAGPLTPHQVLTVEKEPFVKDVFKVVQQSGGHTRKALVLKDKLRFDNHMNYLREVLDRMPNVDVLFGPDHKVTQIKADDDQESYSVVTQNGEEYFVGHLLVVANGSKKVASKLLEDCAHPATFNRSQIQLKHPRKLNIYAYAEDDPEGPSRRKPAKNFAQFKEQFRQEHGEEPVIAGPGGNRRTQTGDGDIFQVVVDVPESLLSSQDERKILEYGYSAMRAYHSRALYNHRVLRYQLFGNTYWEVIDPVIGLPGGKHILIGGDTGIPAHYSLSQGFRNAFEGASSANGAIGISPEGQVSFDAKRYRQDIEALQHKTRREQQKGIEQRKTPDLKRDGRSDFINIVSGIQKVFQDKKADAPSLSKILNLTISEDDYEKIPLQWEHLHEICCFLLHKPSKWLVFSDNHTSETLQVASELKVIKKGVPYNESNYQEQTKKWLKGFLKLQLGIDNSHDEKGSNSNFSQLCDEIITQIVRLYSMGKTEKSKNILQEVFAVLKQADNLDEGQAFQMLRDACVGKLEDKSLHYSIAEKRHGIFGARVAKSFQEVERTIERLDSNSQNPNLS